MVLNTLLSQADKIEEEQVAIDPNKEGRIVRVGDADTQVGKRTTVLTGDWPFRLPGAVIVRFTHRSLTPVLGWAVAAVKLGWFAGVPQGVEELYQLMQGSLAAVGLPIEHRVLAPAIVLFRPGGDTYLVVPGPGMS